MMNTLQRIVALTTMLLITLLPLSLLAQGKAGQRGLGPGMLLRAEMDQARIEALAEVSGKSLEEVQKAVQQRPISLLFKHWNIPLEKFQPIMHSKTINIVIKAHEDGKITTAQKDAMLQQMSSGPRGPMQRGPRGRGRGQGRGQVPYGN